MEAMVDNMTERKWTKGPWQTGKDGWIYDASAEPVCMIEDGGFTGVFEHAEHDAHLIAAAPDLYEALEMCERLAGDLNIDEWQQVMDALAKARGEK